MANHAKTNQASVYSQRDIERGIQVTDEVNGAILWCEGPTDSRASYLPTIAPPTAQSVV